MNTAGKILQGAWDMTKQARSDLTKQARSNDNTYHADKSKATRGNKRDSRRSQPSQGDILAIYEAVSQVYPDVRSQLLEPVRHDPVDVLVATILSQATNDTLSGRAFS